MLDSFKNLKKQINEKIEKFTDDYTYPINPIKLINDVRNGLDDNDIVISDVGAHKIWIAKYYRTYIPNTCLITNGFCSMGFALPGAIAAQIVRPNRKVVVMCGDGGFLLNVQEMENAVRLQLPIISIIWCDSDLGLISLKQNQKFGKNAFTQFNNPDFVKLARSFGAIEYHVKSTEEFPKILDKAKSSKSIPVILEIDVDSSWNQILLNDEN